MLKYSTIAPILAAPVTCRYYYFVVNKYKLALVQLVKQKQ